MCLEGADNSEGADKSDDKPSGTRLPEGLTGRRIVADVCVAA